MKGKKASEESPGFILDDFSSSLFVRLQREKTADAE